MPQLDDILSELLLDVERTILDLDKEGERHRGAMRSLGDDLNATRRRLESLRGTA